VRVSGCTICGSDLHTFEGRRSVATPTILGHEIVGEIAALGSGPPLQDLAGVPLHVGDRITWAIVANCGQCFYCQRGLPQKCLHAVKYGHEAFRPGRELLGGLAEHCLFAPGTSVVKLPAELPLSVACPASCATATIAATLEAAGNVRDRVVVIFGAGLLGLTACAMARYLGASDVICVELNPARRARAADFGASHCVSPGESPQVVQKLTGGYGADAMLELSGASPAFEAALQSVRTGGTIVLVGAVFPTPPVAIAPEQLIRRQLTIRGVHNYAPQHLLAAVRFLAEQHEQYPFAELAATWYPLAQIDQAFAAALDPTRIRVGVTP
jgi:alcohol dehydrogenase